MSRHVMAVLALFLAAGCALAADETPTPEAALTKADECDEDTALDDLLSRMDERAQEIKTLQADITITNRENLSGRESTRKGTLFLWKPGRLVLDLVDDKGYPRKIWVLPERIVDYSPDLKSAIEVSFDAEASGRPEILGLDSTSADLKESFDITLLEPEAETPEAHTLLLVPKEGMKFDFASAKVVLDAKSLLPVTITQEIENLGQTKTYALSSVKENPRLKASVFEPNLPRGTVIDSYEPANWKSP